MIKQLTPWLIAFISVGLMLYGNYLLQRKVLAINNKEKAIDFLIATLTKLKDLYIEYWNSATHDATCSLKIKIQQTLILSIFIFSSRKYKFVNRETLKSEIKNLIVIATSGNFDSKDRTEPDISKCVEIASLSNKCIVKMMDNKI